MVKCSKCGANIPDEAGFCPSCGASKAGGQRAPQASYRSMSPSNPKSVSPLGGIFDMAFSKTAIILVIALGILFAWIGTVIVIFAPDQAKIATLLSSMGFAAMGLFLAAGGIWNSRIDKFVRLAMVLIGIFLVVQSLSVSGLFSSMMSSLSSYMSGFSSIY